jgi:hypothetical protein
MTRFDLVDGMLVLGLLMIGAGLGGFDWRLALMVCGFLLLALGLWLGWRAAGR